MCRLGHPHIPQSIRTGPLDVDLEKEDSKLKLQKSIELEKVKRLSTSVHMRGAGGRAIVITVVIGPTLHECMHSAVARRCFHTSHWPWCACGEVLQHVVSITK